MAVMITIHNALKPIVDWYGGGTEGNRSDLDIVIDLVSDIQKDRAELLNQGKRIEELEKALLRIDNWAKAYPLDIFPEPDFKKAAEVLKAAGLSLDAISASNMRHVINGVKNIAEQALKGGE